MSYRDGPPDKRTAPGRRSGGGKVEYAAGDTIHDEGSTTGRRWTSRDVAMLCELAFSRAAHLIRVAPIDLIEHEAQDFDVRVGRLAQALEAVGGGR